MQSTGIGSAQLPTKREDIPRRRNNDTPPVSTAPPTRRRGRQLVFDRIYDGICSVRLNGRIVAYTAETRLPSGRVLSSIFPVGKGKHAEVLGEAAAEKRRQLAQGAIGADSRPATADAHATKQSGPNHKRTLDTFREAMVAADLMESQRSYLKYVYRLPEAGPVGGWRVMRHGRKKKGSRIFLDGHFGGAAAALDKALEYRDSLTPKPSGRSIRTRTAPKTGSQHE